MALKPEKLKRLEELEQLKLPIGSSATYLAPYKIQPTSIGPIVISAPKKNPLNRSSNAERTITWDPAKEIQDGSSSSSSSSPTPPMEPSTPKAAVVKVQAQRSPLQQQHQEQHHPVEDRRQLLLRKSESGTGDLRRKFEEMKRMTKEHLRKEEDAYRKELEMKERILQLETLLKGTDTRARRWREGQQPPFIPGEQRRKIVKKESKYPVPIDSFPKLKSPWADIYAMRENPTGIDCRDGPNPWHTCKFCPGDCWHDGYNSAIALFLFALLGYLTFLVFGDIRDSASKSFVEEFRRTLCSLRAAFLG